MEQIPSTEELLARCSRVSEADLWKTINEIRGRRTTYQDLTTKKTKATSVSTTNGKRATRKPKVPQFDIAKLASLNDLAKGMRK